MLTAVQSNVTHSASASTLERQSTLERERLLTLHAFNTERVTTSYCLCIVTHLHANAVYSYLLPTFPLPSLPLPSFPLSTLPLPGLPRIPKTPQKL